MDLNPIDIAAFVAFLVVLSAAGFLSTRGRDTTANYFLAGKTLPWYVIGSSSLAANVSSEHFIGMVGATFIYGIVVANYSWANALTLPFMIFLFIPFLLSSGVYTIPEYLEKRFGSALRQIFAVVTIVANVLVFLGAVLYAGALAMQQLFGWDLWTSIIVLGAVSGIWSVYGGLASVAWTGLVVAIVLFGGGLMVTYLGLEALSGGTGSILDGFRLMLDTNMALSGSWKDAVESNMSNLSSTGTYNRLSVIQPPDHPFFPWTGYLPIVLSVSIWYNVLNQFMVQRVLAARDPYHARMGILFSGYLQILLPFIVVIPGLILFTLHPEILMQPWGEAQRAADRGYVSLLQELIPAGLRGIFLAALFGAIQATVNAVLNSTATVFTMDIYKRWIQPGAAESKLVRVGMVTSVVAVIVSIGVAGLLQNFDSGVFVFIQTMNAFFAPPFAAIFLLGMLSKSVSARGALYGVIGGFAAAVALKILVNGDVEAPRWISAFAHQAGIVWAVSTLITLGVSSVDRTPPRDMSALVFDIRNSILRDGMGKRWYTSVYFWWIVLSLIVIVLSATFSGAVFAPTVLD